MLVQLFRALQPLFVQQLRLRFRPGAMFLPLDHPGSPLFKDPVPKRNFFHISGRLKIKDSLVPNAENHLKILFQRIDLSNSPLYICFFSLPPGTAKPEAPTGRRVRPTSPADESGRPVRPGRWSRHGSQMRRPRFGPDSSGPNSARPGGQLLQFVTDRTKVPISDPLEAKKVTEPTR